MVQPEEIVITEEGGTSGKIEMELDKTTAKVGDIITVSLKVEDITHFAGYQVNIKCDPEMLEVIDPVPQAGEILNNKEYGSVDQSANDPEKGLLNFGKVYQYLDDYRSDGNPEETGVFGIIEFKAKKAGKTEIRFEDTETMPNGTTGTLLFDWDGNRISGYEVVQPEEIVITEEGGTSGKIEMELDKTTAKVGDIITVSLKVEDITHFAGYQVNIKYDPEMLEVIDPVPQAGEILNNKEYGSVDQSANDPEKGLLNFGKVYQYLDDYRSDGNPEETGVFGIIEFKAKKAGKTEIRFEDTETMPNGTTGTLLFDWDGNRISGYEVVQPEEIVITEEGGTSGKIEMELDKTTAKVGDIITVSLKVEDITHFAGYEVEYKV